ncbi:phosphoglucomutase (alpha-D-glucose-1,6-bisphosphate-dependent) [Lichenicoccus sp.]|uniref:phosphoglucomutase (alpha-D-glucose-1,6-bisphosphate-dependent) n=1 Tax=Lichenicoccus sp. TaxID=2781899 RepID=UPI003D09773D
MSEATIVPGKPVPLSRLIDVPGLVTAYHAGKPDPEVAAERVSFGTSGHRGTSGQNSFNALHILAIAQAICFYRKAQGIDGPLFLGRDTHALSFPAFVSAIEVFAANDVVTMVDAEDGFTPTPVVSRSILTHNRGRSAGLADGVLITPSHNPPQDGGFKYNPPHGGPAGSEATDWIEAAANRFMADPGQIRRHSYDTALRSGLVHRHDYVGAYVGDLASVLDMDAIAASGLNIGIDPLGGAAVRYWEPIIARYGLRATLVNPDTDPTFRFMTADWDGKIRMDCSSPYAMAGLIGMRERFDLAFANDPDADRHGIVTRSAGLMNPNHYLTVAIDYLFSHRPDWREGAGIGKTIVSSSSIDRVAEKLKRRLVEVPVGFKWFVDGLTDGTLGFGGEESAGASFVRRDGSVWSTDKDGLIMGLLAAEIMATTGRDPAEHYARLTESLGAPCYERIDAAASPAQKALLKQLRPEQVAAEELAGEPITARLTAAPGNQQPFGGLKITTRNGWFAARPSGTENVYKIYTESFVDGAHLARIQDEAKAIITRTFKAAGLQA